MLRPEYYDKEEASAYENGFHTGVCVMGFLVSVTCLVANYIKKNR